MKRLTFLFDVDNKIWPIFYHIKEPFLKLQAGFWVRDFSEIDAIGEFCNI